MQEEQIRTALNTHWHASAVDDANTNMIFTMTMPVIPSRASESSDEAFLGLAESSSR